MAHTRADIPGRIDREVRFANFTTKGRDEDGEYDEHVEPAIVGSYDEANVLTSIIAPSETTWDALVGQHAPVLDLDFPCTLLDSTTPGHHHLVIDRPLTWDQLVILMDAMAVVGLLEVGYVAAAKRRGYTSIRLPWVRKMPPAEVTPSVSIDF